MVLLEIPTMKRLWVFIFLGLMLMIQPGFSTEAITLTNSATPADAPPLSGIRRIYGENIAAEIFSDITTDEVREIVRKFTENGSRYIMDYTMVGVGANYLARNYILRQFSLLSNDRMEIELIGNHVNIVGKLPGYMPGEHPAIVVSANYDSPQNSPGANGDGSGIAVVLSLVRMLSQYEWPLDIYFIAFNGLYTLDYMSGSPEVANVFQQREIDILAFYNIDTLLLPDPEGFASERIEMGYISGGQQDYHKSQYWAELTSMMSNNYGSNYITTVSSGSFPLWTLSDHYSFYERGYEDLVCASQSGHADDSYTGTSADTWDNRQYIYALGRETTGSIGASIAFTMSRKYGSPITLEHSFSNGPGGYEVLQFCVTTPTIVNISSRWFGGTTTYYLVDPNLNFVGGNPVEYNTTSAWESTEIFSEQLTTKGTYQLVSLNTDITPVGYEVSITYESDIDSNGILDHEEYWLDPSYFESDQDNDGISDAEEIFLGTDMNSIDSDLDTMPDKYEIDNGFDPTDPSDGNEDEDGDGLSNAQEYTGGLNPFSKDSDGDLIDDLWELTYGLDPLNPDDANLDLDGDDITNLEEYLAGTDPTVSDVEQVPMIWYVSSVIVIAPIVGLLYIRRRNKQLIT